MSQLLRDELAQMIDHTFLKPEGTREQVEQLAREAGAVSYTHLTLPTTPYV